MTDREGHVGIDQIPPGITGFPSGIRTLGRPKKFDVTVEPNGTARLDVRIPEPIGRLYANQMMDGPYMRYDMTEDGQGQIVPTMGKQRY